MPVKIARKTRFYMEANSGLHSDDKKGGVAMSNRNWNQNHGNNNGVNNQTNPGNQNPTTPADGEEKKESLRKRLNRRYQKLRTKKIVRVGIRVAKFAAFGLSGFIGYKVGRKSVKPTVVMVEPVTPEEEPKPEEQATEPEPAEQENE